MLKKILLFLFPKTIAEIKAETVSAVEQAIWERDIIHIYGSIEAYYKYQEYQSRLQQEEEEYYERLRDEEDFLNNYVYSNYSEEEDCPSNDPEEVELQSSVPLREDYTKMLEGVHIHLHSKQGTYIVEKILPNGFKVCYNDKIFPFSDFKMYAGRYWQHDIKQD